jgi:hypothetical protein
MTFGAWRSRYSRTAPHRHPGRWLEICAWGRQGFRLRTAARIQLRDANNTIIFSGHAFYGNNVTGELKRGEKSEVLAKVKGWV